MEPALQARRPGRPRTWRVIDRGSVPEGSRTIEFSCPGCGVDALLPVAGVALAQVGPGLVFDGGPRAIPAEIECRSCRRRFEREG